MIGETISHYRILDKLGGGGMGVVYRAQDLKLERLVALKFLPPSFGNDEERKERFIIEAKAASALDHPNIGTIYEVDETRDGRLFIAMAYYRGETLKRKLSARPLDRETAIDLAIQVARGLAKVHGENILHRDIKPANVIVTEDGLAKIVDFGLAKLVTETSITGAGASMGTPAYMSPEQTRGDAVDARTDLWSLGVLLHEMLTAELPFRGGHAQAIVHAILNDEPQLDRLRAQHPDLVPIVEKALEKDPAKRYRSADEVLLELESARVASDAPTGVTRIQSSSRALAPGPRRRLGALALAAIVVAGVFLLWRARETKRIDEAVQSLASVVESGNLDAVFERLRSLELSLVDARLSDVAASVAGSLTIETDPEGVLVEISRATPQESDAWDSAGTSPVTRHPLVAGEYFVRLSRAGLESAAFLLRIGVGEELRIVRRLVPDGSVPEGMVFVDEGPSTILGGAVVSAFLIDRNEVTNAQFLEFVAQGGYSNPALWTVDRQPFVDRTGIPGPRVWSGGTYPEGKQDHPVVGVSWQEAAAYCGWSEKELPSWNQWWRAALGDTGEVFPWGNAVEDIDARANFSLAGTRAVGSFRRGTSPFGVHDMAGNVREWVKEPTEDGRRRAVGGSWLDPTYMFEPGQAEPFDTDYANEAIGLRCVKETS